MKITKRIGALVLALVILAGVVGTTAFAAEKIGGNDWYGDQVAVDVTAGTEGYNYMSLFRKYVHGYEFGGHFMGEGEGPQTFVVLDTNALDGTTWTPSGVYVPNESNYEVAYCCDVETMIVDATYYKRTNLENSGYYNEEHAAKIRAIVTNSYPYVTLEAMKADLAANGYPYAEELTRNEVIAAVQTAIWACANTEGEPMRYAKSYNVSDNLQWGYPMYDTSADSGLDVAGKRVFKSYEEVGTRIDTLVDYLLEQDAAYAEKNQIVISELKLMGAPVMLNAEEELCQFNVCVKLNNSGSGYEDHIVITVNAGESEVVVPVVLGQNEYNITINAKRGDEIKAVVSGTQVLPAGVYFYAPKPADVNGDGVATSREVSQNLVGVAMGETEVYAEDTITFNELTFKPGTISNVSYMFIDKATGEIEFLKKIDLDGDDSIVPIIRKDDCISVMFLKQSTSGMFWFAQEVDEETQQAVIECLKDNNPSYKGYNAFTFGAGSFELEFKSGRFATYTFTGVKEGDYVKPEEAPEVEIPEVETPEEEVPDK